jgi:hypothetical protein
MPPSEPRDLIKAKGEVKKLLVNEQKRKSQAIEQSKEGTPSHKNKDSNVNVRNSVNVKTLKDRNKGLRNLSN